MATFLIKKFAPKLSFRAKLFLLLSIAVMLVLLKYKLENPTELAEPIFRRKLCRVRTSKDEFCLVSYNILADIAIDRYPDGFLPLKHEEKLRRPNPKTSLRHVQLMKELKWLQPDIISLQEVEEYYFQILAREFSSWNFEGVFHLHYQDSNGVATFFNTKRFIMNKTVTHGFNELLGKLYDVKQLENANRHNQRVAKFTLLEDRETGKHLVVATTHVLFGRWKQPDMQALQVSLFLQELRKFINSGTGSGPVPWVISGDFNTYPHFPTYELISNGKLSPEGLTRLNPNRYKYPQVVERDVVENKKTFVLEKCRQHLSHSLKDIKSAYKTVLKREPPLTHYQKDKNFPELYGFEIMKGTLDYIWYSSDKLYVNAVLEQVKEEVIVPLVACPNKFFPSDHLSLKACFSFKT